MPGDVETRILALERRVWQLPVWALEQQVAALTQGINQAWGGMGFGSAPPPPSPPGCPGVTLATTVIMHDSVFGDCPLVYDPASMSWFGCKTVSYPGAGVCGAVSSTPIGYRISASLTGFTGFLYYHLIQSTGNHCILAGTCASTLTPSPPQGVGISCTGDTRLTPTQISAPWTRVPVWTFNMLTGA